MEEYTDWLSEDDRSFQDAITYLQGSDFTNSPAGKNLKNHNKN